MKYKIFIRSIEGDESEVVADGYTDGWPGCFKYVNNNGLVCIPWHAVMLVVIKDVESE